MVLTRLFFIFFLFMNGLFATDSIQIIPKSVISEQRLRLTEDYALRHYGVKTYQLHQPKIIVIHYTATATLEMTMDVFKPATISNTRTKLSPFGKLNVGAHYVVDKDGTIYNLIPTTIMGRHVNGFNHVSIGIENVATSEGGLTYEQLTANAKLVQHLIKRHPSLEHLIGHHEYMHLRYPHFKYRKQKDKTYEPLIKIDPGFSFMKNLRNHLKSQYGIELER